MRPLYKNMQEELTLKIFANDEKDSIRRAIEEFSIITNWEMDIEYIDTKYNEISDSYDVKIINNYTVKIL